MKESKYTEVCVLMVGKILHSILTTYIYIYTPTSSFYSSILQNYAVFHSSCFGGFQIMLPTNPSAFGMQQFVNDLVITFTKQDLDPRRFFGSGSLLPPLCFEETTSPGSEGHNFDYLKNSCNTSDCNIVSLFFPRHNFLIAVHLYQMCTSHFQTI